MYIGYISIYIYNIYMTDSRDSIELLGEEQFGNKNGYIPTDEDTGETRPTPFVALCLVPSPLSLPSSRLPSPLLPSPLSPLSQPPH
jgi:hypothetical protein